MKASDIVIEFSTQFGNYEKTLSELKDRLNKMAKPSGFYVNGKKVSDVWSMETDNTKPAGRSIISFILSDGTGAWRSKDRLEINTPQYKVTDSIKQQYLQTLPGYTELWLTDERTEELFDTDLYKNFKAGWEACNEIHKTAVRDPSKWKATINDYTTLGNKAKDK